MKMFRLFRTINYDMIHLICNKIRMCFSFSSLSSKSSEICAFRFHTHIFQLLLRIVIYSSQVQFRFPLSFSFCRWFIFRFIIFAIVKMVLDVMHLTLARGFVYAINRTIFRIKVQKRVIA